MGSTNFNSLWASKNGLVGFCGSGAFASVCGEK